jgi:dTDP-4-dehydrorhamnose reductase
MALNAAAPRILASATRDAGLPLIHVSTDFVFDGLKGAPYVETDLPMPLGAYARSKRAGEVAVAETNPFHAIVRTAWLVSPFGNNFLKTILRLNAERPELRIVADQRGSPTSTLDLAPALIEMARKLARDENLAGIYHAANSGDATWHSLASEIVTAAARHGVPAKPMHAIATADYPLPAKRPQDSRLNTSKMHDLLGFSLPPWQGAIAEIVRRLVAK